VATLAEVDRTPIRFVRSAAESSTRPALEESVDVARAVSTLRAAGCVFAEEEADLILESAASPADIAAMVTRRAAGEPLEQVVGHARFCGLRIALEPGVFVPRHRTEFLVRTAVGLLRAGRRGLADPRSPADAKDPTDPTDPKDPATPEDPVASARLVVDLCCGSGALGAAVAALVEPTDDAGRLALHAADCDPAAVRCARRNLEPFGGRVHQGDLFAALPGDLRGRVEVLLANLPYVPSGEIALLPAEARLHEPRVSLDGGADGLDVFRRVAGEARRWLAPGGHLLVETGERQAGTALEVAGSGGLDARIVTDDDLEATVLVATRP
jgi:release factor glutamine methyltransferase